MSTGQATSFMLIERPIYGSSRVGIDNTQLELIGYTEPTDGIVSNVLGQKQYELVNHLGNVLSTVSDVKIPVDDNSDGTIDYYLAVITSATDYYPFGSPMDHRTYSSNTYRFGFNGQEKDDEVAGAGNTNTALFWEYDTRLGRRWNLDPKPVQGFSQYSCFQNNPIFFIDINGDTPWPMLILGMFFKEPSSVYRTKEQHDNGEGRVHPGIDLYCKKNATVIAAAEGEVVFAGSKRKWNGKNNGYGYVVIIKHKNGYYTRYAHLNEPTIKEGTKVENGQVIGTVAGYNTHPGEALWGGIHLHFEIYKEKWGKEKKIDPASIDDLQFLVAEPKELPVFEVVADRIVKKRNSDGSSEGSSGGSGSGNSTEKHDSTLEPPPSTTPPSTDPTNKNP